MSFFKKLFGKFEKAFSETKLQKGKTRTEEDLSESETVQIGNQIWMKRNLDVDHFLNGNPIPEVRTNQEWIEAGKNEQPAWCYYENNPENGMIYGKLFNWYAVNDPGGLAPEGFHVPSDEEWRVLTEYLGGEKSAGGKMKSSGSHYWKRPNEGATNSSGLSGLPGGDRDTNGDFNNVALMSRWWSSSEASTGDAWNRLLNCLNGDVNGFSLNKCRGLSVRCLKDKTSIDTTPIESKLPKAAMTTYQKDDSDPAKSLFNAIALVLVQSENNVDPAWELLKNETGNLNGIWIANSKLANDSIYILSVLTHSKVGEEAKLAIMRGNFRVEPNNRNSNGGSLIWLDL